MSTLLPFTFIPFVSNHHLTANTPSTNTIKTEITTPATAPSEREKEAVVRSATATGAGMGIAVEDEAVAEAEGEGEGAGEEEREGEGRGVEEEVGIVPVEELETTVVFGILLIVNVPLE